MIRPLQTTYGGTRFRSRAEARWALFFDVAGIAYDYEAEGFLIRSGAYLPDFWLRDLKMFLEVKGAEPADEEIAKCAELTTASECDVLLAVGPPEDRFQLLWFDRGGQREGRYVFAQDKLVQCGFWLIEETGDAERCWIGPSRTAELPRGPMFMGALEEAYHTARACRFDGYERTRRLPPAAHEAWRLGEDAAA